jgi:germination protein M
MSLLRVKIIVVGLIVVALALILVLREREPGGVLPAGDAAEEQMGRGVQSVVVVFADRAASRLLEERRDIEVPEDRAERAKKILEELIRGPQSAGAVRTLPEGTGIIRVFFDERGGVFVDFTRELVENHPGGSTGELFTIRSVVQTLSRNFPDVESVGFLVDGREIETIAGHIDATVPFDVGQYR